MQIKLRKKTNSKHENDSARMPLAVDEAFETHKLGIRTLKLTLLIYLITAAFQFVIAIASGSIALLADTLHNFADAFTSIPLWIAFVLARRGVTKHFTYGYGKAEDVAGILIVVVILFSAVIAFYEAIHKLMHPASMAHLGWVAAAAIIGFIGNEVVAELRIRVGKKIGSAVLVADGYHARSDGFTSLAVLLGVIGSKFGWAIVDPLVGIGITVVIMFIVKDAITTVFIRLLDGIDPNTIIQIHHVTENLDGVMKVKKVRARWTGHHILSEIQIAVDPKLTVHEVDKLVQTIEAELREKVESLHDITISVRSFHREK